MPQVPRVTRQVSTAPLPGVRRTAAETAESQGAGLEQAKGQASLAVADFGGTAARLAGGIAANAFEAERQHADQVALLNAERQLAEWENKAIYDPTTGALQRKGKDSFTLPEELAAEFDKVAGEVEKTMSTDRQRIAFNRIKAQRGLSLDLTARRHVFGEMQRYEAEELEGFLENTQNAAIANALDPRRVSEELTRAVTKVRTHGPTLGLGPEQIEKQVEAVTTKIHVGVLDRLLALDKDKAAKIYFEETRDQIKGEALARVEKALEEGSLRGEGQRKADEIIAAGGTIAEQRATVKSIADPELRDQVQQRVEHEIIMKERAQREADEAVQTAAYNILDQTGDVSRIPPAQWASFDGGTKSAMRSYAEHVARGVPVQTDLPTFYRLIQMAGNDPDAFLKENMLAYKAKLDEAEFKQLAGLQLSIKAGNTKAAEKDLSGFRTKDQIITDTLATFGIKTDAKAGSPEEKAIAQLRRNLDIQVEAQQALTGKQPSNQDIQAMLDRMLSTTVETKGSWWGLWPWADAGYNFRDQTKRVVDMTIKDVPAQARTQIEEALRKANRPVSDATVLGLYIETMMRTGGK